MSWHEHHLNRNTARSAAASEDIFDGQRRAELERVGLIDFNAPAAVVRAVERRLAIERGERVRKMYNYDVLKHMIGWSLGAVLVGFVVVVSAGRISGVAAAIGALLLIGGGLSATFGFAERNVSEQLYNDAKQLTAYEAARGRRGIEG